MRNPLSRTWLCLDCHCAIDAAVCECGSRATMPFPKALQWQEGARRLTERQSIDEVLASIECETAREKTSLQGQRVK